MSERTNDAEFIRVLPDGTGEPSVAPAAEEDAEEAAKRQFLAGRTKLGKKDHGVIWHSLLSFSDRLYTLIGNSLGGRVMTSYRRGRTALTTGERPSDTRPLSPARSRVVRAVNGSGLLRFTETLFGAMAGVPLRAIGGCLAANGLIGVLIQAILTSMRRDVTFDINRTVTFTILLLLSIPLFVSSKTLRTSLYASRFCRGLLCGFLGLPEEDFREKRSRVPTLVLYVVPVLLGVASAAASLWIQPLTGPLSLVGLGTVGLVLFYPEVGALLSTLCLPFTWIGEATLTFTAALILLTWVGYGFDLLRLRRRFRFGRLDAAYAVMMLLILLGGVSATVFSPEALLQSLLAFVLLSDYFLLSNLMNTRAYVNRCLGGVAVSILFMTLLCFVRQIPAGVFDWMDDLAGMRQLLGEFRSTTDFLSSLWADNFELFLILMLPWQYALLLRCRRLGQVFSMLVFLALDLWAVSASDSVMAFAGVLLAFSLFFILYSRKTPAVGLVLLPVVVSAGTVYSIFRPFGGVLTSVLGVLAETTVRRTRLWSGVWRMILDHPMGIGVSEAAFRSVFPSYADPGLYEASVTGSLYLDVLVAFGWAGAAVFACVLFLFVQKCLTALKGTAERRDRALLLGGLISFASLLVLGFGRSFAVIPKPAFIIALSTGVGSAFSNILFDEQDVLSARTADSAAAADRFFA